jgi:KDO2-lipid IV(A) lauroyltransferase
MLALIRWLSRRPLRFLHALGAGLGWLTFLLSPTYRRRLGANATQAGLDARQRRRSVAEAGRLVAEMPWLWLRPASRPIADWVEWQGAELIDRALDEGRGLVLLTPHLGCFEVCAQGYAERFGARQPITALYSPARQPWLRTLEEGARQRSGLLTAPASLAGVRQMLRALRKGECVGLLPDQVPPQGMGVWAPFFGRPAYTMTLAAKLVLQSGAPLLVMWGERLDGGRGWRLRVDATPPLPTAVEGGDAALQQACASVINAEMERLIRRRPEQYLWSYNRYKQPRAELAR